MRITSLPQIYRNVRRWREIIAVLRRYGLADWLSRFQIDFLRDLYKDPAGVPLSQYTRERRIRLALLELGPTFIKFGQMLSLRPDLVGWQLAEELAQLQSQTASDDFAMVTYTIRQCLGESLMANFAEIDTEPIASASIGQVHAAKLVDGTSVVIKVQHAGIESKIDEDLAILMGLAGLAARVPEFAAWQPVELVRQLSRSLQNELSFERELNQLQRFGKELAGQRQVKVPAVYPHLSGRRVLTMERLGGQPIACFSDETLRKSSDSAIDAAECCEHAAAVPIDRTQLATRITHLFAHMIFRMGVYHADPHPGNVRVLDDGSIGLLDFGMVGRIDDSLRHSLEEMLLAIAAADSRYLTVLIRRVGRLPSRIDEAQLAADVADFVEMYATQPLDRFDLTMVLGEVSELMHRHHIMLPASAGMLLKTLVTLEGTLRRLQPEFSLLEVLRPVLRRMRLRRLSPAYQARKFRRIAAEVEEIVDRLPSDINAILDRLERGEIDLQFEHRGLEPAVNRLVLGLLASSLVLAAAVLLALKAPPLLFAEATFGGLKDLSLFGLLAAFTAMAVITRLLLAINRSGHLNGR